MKLMLHSGALRRVEERLGKLGLPLELYVVDQDGRITHNGAVVAPSEAKPEVVWASLDTYMGGQFRTFFSVAMEAASVKWVQTFNAGLDLPIFREIVRKGIRLSNSSAQAVAIAEFVMGQVLAEWYPTREYREAQTAHEWRRVSFRELSQSRWLIVGYGHIGREVAKRARAFGARIAGVRRSAKGDEFVDQLGTMAELPKMLPEADVVVLAAALNDETRDIANAGFFGRMKKGSIIVNIGRGGLVDEDALVAALEKDTPRVAILDVFRQEPLPRDSPLWDNAKIRISAHTSPSSSGTVARGDQLFLDNLALYAKGAPLLTEVDENFF